MSECVERLSAAQMTIDPAEERSDLAASVLETAAAVVRHFPFLLAEPPAPSLPALLGRALDENLHSDFLAGLLSSHRAGAFARAFLNVVLSQVGIEETDRSSTPQFAHREVRLDEVSCRLAGTDLGARRIDVLIRTGGRVVVIENKTLTTESANQTRDYAEVIKARYQNERSVHCLFLSPTGMKADHADFQPLSYRGLYEALKAAAGTCPIHPRAEVLLQAYLNCLAFDFVYPEERVLLASREVIERGLR